eukprot:scaffold178306_cov24-Tisochrysis_lutea.AAC.1
MIPTTPKYNGVEDNLNGGPCKMATEAALLLLGGLEVNLGPGDFKAFDLHKMDVTLFWKELARKVNLGNTGSWSLALFSLEQLPCISLMALRATREVPRLVAGMGGEQLWCMIAVSGALGYVGG